MVGCRKGVVGVLGRGPLAERIKARGKVLTNKLRKYTVKNRGSRMPARHGRTLHYHDSALSRQISRAGSCALAARGACWRTLGTTKAGEYWRRCADILRVVSGRSVGSRSSGRGVKQKHVSREEGSGIDGGTSRLLRPSEYKFKDRELHDGRRAVVSITSTARSILSLGPRRKHRSRVRPRPRAERGFPEVFPREPGEKASLFYLQDSCRGCRWTSRTGTSTWSSRKTRTWRRRCTCRSRSRSWNHRSRP